MSWNELVFSPEGELRFVHWTFQGMYRCQPSHEVEISDETCDQIEQEGSAEFSPWPILFIKVDRNQLLGLSQDTVCTLVDGAI